MCRPTARRIDRVTRRWSPSRSSPARSASTRVGVEPVRDGCASFRSTPVVACVVRLCPLVRSGEEWAHACERAARDVTLSKGGAGRTNASETVGDRRPRDACVYAMSTRCPRHVARDARRGVGPFRFDFFFERHLTFLAFFPFNTPPPPRTEPTDDRGGRASGSAEGGGDAGQPRQRRETAGVAPDPAASRRGMARRQGFPLVGEGQVRRRPPQPRVSTGPQPWRMKKKNAPPLRIFPRRRAPMTYSR